jgi:hypothetical protein
MRFVSHARRIKYVVAGHPRRKIANKETGVTDSYPGLEARFLNHVFDSEQSQIAKGWTIEQRKIVESYMLGHPDFDRPGGFYLDVASTGESKADVLRNAGHPMADSPAVGNQERCMFFYPDPDHSGEVAQCPAAALAHSEFCGSHQPEAVADDQGPAPSPEPVLVPAAPADEWKMPPIGEG